MRETTTIVRRGLFICAAAALALGLGGCGGRAFTGPVEVTRFVAEAPQGLGSGTIALRFSEELTSEAAREAFRASVGNELALIGYTLVGEGAEAGQIAAIETSRTPVETSEPGRPVNVGVGGGTGGMGVGVGIDLGARDAGPRVISRLAVRISDRSGKTLWEGRAAHPISIDSAYAPLAASARVLARGLFREFPGNNGETVEISVDTLQD
ncbi:MAG: hypothetical protein V2I27_08495 [Erythrobacter sp.]|jgi:hypothetical protein|nr:hypothetical protein [Erythrobacter sp.]